MLSAASIHNVFKVSTIIIFYFSFKVTRNNKYHLRNTNTTIITAFEKKPNWPLCTESTINPQTYNEVKVATRDRK